MGHRRQEHRSATVDDLPLAFAVAQAQDHKMAALDQAGKLGCVARRHIESEFVHPSMPPRLNLGRFTSQGDHRVSGFEGESHAMVADATRRAEHRDAEARRRLLEVAGHGRRGLAHAEPLPCR